VSLSGKHVLITGSARRVGRILALSVAQAGGIVFIHHAHSPEDAKLLRQEIIELGGKAYILQADLLDPSMAQKLIDQASTYGPLHALVNNAAIFEPLSWETTDLEAWNRHLALNLTAPFLLSQAFARSHTELTGGRIVNILDWRALRPGPDHFPYTISKAALVALTRSLAIALSPQITVNGIALGAMLPPTHPVDLRKVIQHVPAGRWADPEEVGDALIFLLEGPSYITGEIIHLDGGRHLV